MNTNTPRTDALISDKEVFCFDATDLEPALRLANFARQLERELNEAERKLRLVGFYGENGDLVRELDEAKRQADMLQKYLNESATERDQWRAMAQELARCLSDSDRHVPPYYLKDNNKVVISRFNELNKQG